MINDEQIAAHWWRWWTNPCEGLHADKVNWLKSQGVIWSDSADLSLVVKVRRLLNISATPDDCMLSQPDLVLVALIDYMEIKGLHSRLPCMVLEDSILKARPSDWESLYGVHDTELIRDLISSFRGLSPELETIRIQVMNALRDKRAGSISVRQGTQIVLGLFFRQFVPVFYQRWVATMSDHVEACIRLVPPLSREDLIDEFKSWVQEPLEAEVRRYVAGFEIPEIDFSEAQA
jgi:hypothetical protein